MIGSHEDAQENPHHGAAADVFGSREALDDVEADLSPSKTNFGVLTEIGYIIAFSIIGCFIREALEKAAPASFRGVRFVRFFRIVPDSRAVAHSSIWILTPWALLRWQG